MPRIALIAAAGLALTACGGSHARVSSPPPHAHSRYPVVVHSPRIEPLEATRIRVRRIDSLAQLFSPTQLRIVTTGSSSCPSVPDELTVLSRHRIRLRLTAGSWDGDKLVTRKPPGGVCTTDFGTTQMVVTIDPTLVDVHHALTVLFAYSRSAKPLVRVAPGLS